MWCTKCGNELRDGAKFCPKCGTKCEVPQAKVAVKATPTRSPRPVVIVVAIVVVVLIIVGVVVGVNMKAAADAQALREASAEMLEPWQAKVDAVSTGATDRNELLSRYNELEQVKTALQAALDAGELKLSNGTDCDISDVIALIESKQSAIRDWFASDYETRLKSATLADGASADTTSRDAAQAASETLVALSANIEAEKAIWGANASEKTNSGATYADLVSRVNTQYQCASGIVSQIDAAAEAARVAAAAEAKSEFQARLDSIYSNYSSKVTSTNSASSARQLQSNFFTEFDNLISDIKSYAAQNCSASVQSQISSIESGNQSAYRSYYEVNNSKGILGVMNTRTQQMIDLL